MMRILLDLTKYLFLEYRDFIYKKVTRRAILKPWMKYREIEVIVEILKNLKPKMCLEWGAGYSTLYFSKFIDFEKIKSLNKNPNVEIYLVEPNNYPWSDVYGDGDYPDLRDYIEYPTKFGKFDFILIDGRARKYYCLMKAYELLNDDGVVVLHDANRKYYHEPFKLYKHSLLLTDYREGAGGLWIGSKNIKIENVVDVNRHVKLWKVVSKFGWMRI